METDVLMQLFGFVAGVDRWMASITGLRAAGDATYVDAACDDYRVFLDGVCVLRQSTTPISTHQGIGQSRERLWNSTPLSSTGKVVYTLKTPYRDGTAKVAIDPVDFIARFTALVPKPCGNFTRYHRVLAPNHRWRELV